MRLRAELPRVIAVRHRRRRDAGRRERATEIVCSTKTGAWITSGGGFSTYYAAPSYQTSAISTYFSRAPTPVAGYNATGRGYPDVAMAGHSYIIYDGGTTLIEDGTSASSPVVGAMVANVNALRVAAGKSAVGFLNPTLYAAGTASFNDITSGNNKCGSDEAKATVPGGCCSQGFDAEEGWDPVTGLGSVDFAKFKRLFGV